MDKASSLSLIQKNLLILHTFVDLKDKYNTDGNNLKRQCEHLMDSFLMDTFFGQHAWNLIKVPQNIIPLEIKRQRCKT